MEKIFCYTILLNALYYGTSKHLHKQPKCWLELTGDRDSPVTSHHFPGVTLSSLFLFCFPFCTRDRTSAVICHHLPSITLPSLLSVYSTRCGSFIIYVTFFKIFPLGLRKPGVPWVKAVLNLVWSEQCRPIKQRTCSYIYVTTTSTYYLHKVKRCPVN